MRNGSNLRNLAKDSHKQFVDYLVPGQRLLEATDLVIRVCTTLKIVPPALALYHASATHYHSSEEGICVIYLMSRALHSERYPTQLYHEVAHHLYAIEGDSALHDEGFTRCLMRVLDGDNYKLDYNWRYEYAKVRILAAKAGYLPKDYDPKKWSTLRGYNERAVSEASG